MPRLLIAALVLLTFPAMWSPHVPGGRKGNDADARFMALATEFIHASLAMIPSSASAAGYHEHRDRQTGRTVQLDAVLDDFSAEGFDRQQRFYREWRSRFAATPKQALGPQEAADWQLIDDQIALQLLEYQRIQNTRHNPTVQVEAIGSALFLPLTQEYAPKDTRIAHVLSRLEQVPRALEQARGILVDADPIFVKVAVEENEGNIDLVEHTIRQAIPDGSPLVARYDSVAPRAIEAFRAFNAWLSHDLAERTTDRTWRLGKTLYDEKFKFVLETPSTPEQALADAEAELTRTRTEMMELALPLHAEWFPDHGDHTSAAGEDRENVVLGEVLQRISDDHPPRATLLESISTDLQGITQFIRDHRIVSLSPRDNLRVIPTPPFMRGIYSVAGFHSAPPLEPTAEAEYWVTPIDPAMPEAKAESKLREYNRWVLLWLTIHEALPGHYIQAEHANDIQPEARKLLRNLFGNGAYVEGWAEYIADVMVNAGFADRDPRFQISRKKIWLRAVANSILDVKLQTMGMSDQEALDLMEKRCFQTRAEAEGKLQRAKLSSAQLPTYFTGGRAWWRFRERYEQKAGRAFDMLRFHDEALALGPLPVSVVEQLIK